MRLILGIGSVCAFAASIAGAVGLAAGPAASAGSKALPLGSLSLGVSGPGDAPAGFTARSFSVRCPGVPEPAEGIIATAPALARARGVIMFFSGGLGTGYWGARTESLEFFEALRRDGFTLVQVRWVDSWMESTPGERVGPARLACRPATVVKWAHDRIFEPLGVKPANVGRCGFCITGNSGGASQVSYALSHFGLETLLDAVVPTGGPPHAALAKGCLGSDRSSALPAGKIDGSYGFARGRGPCARRDESFRARWLGDGIATGGNDFFHPRTRIAFILGGQDPTSAVPQAAEYVARLRVAGSRRVTVRRPPDVPHGIAGSKAGLVLLRALLRA
ncbi:MAG: hypothetical protein MSC30_07685 [Gaiellaceae bacterium MAG52_C11]|nr:hypothetical protein [Candidatus Gaiellasilicea maunaloa]